MAVALEAFAKADVGDEGGETADSEQQKKKSHQKESDRPAGQVRAFNALGTLECEGSNSGKK
jgi:hypothetical protein